MVREIDLLFSEKSFKTSHATRVEAVALQRWKADAPKIIDQLGAGANLVIPLSLHNNFPSVFYFIFCIFKLYYFRYFNLIKMAFQKKNDNEALLDGFIRVM